MTRIASHIAMILTVSAAASAQTTDTAKTTLQRALAYQFQFRAGQTEVVPEYVAMLEEATKSDAENADLANAMGVAYLAQGARAMMPGGHPADAMAALPKGLAALERAMQLNPNHAEAMATHGGVTAFIGLMQRGPAGAARGLDEMRPGDYLRLMRGDLHAENGASGLAREQYATVAKSSSPANTVATARLAALDDGGVAAANSRKLRAQAGTNCLMCHGK